MKEEKKVFEQLVDRLKVKEMIKNAKVKGLIKSHTEAFEKISAEKEVHKGKTSYFCN